MDWRAKSTCLTWGVVAKAPDTALQKLECVAPALEPMEVSLGCSAPFPAPQRLSPGIQDLLLMPIGWCGPFPLFSLRASPGLVLGTPAKAASSQALLHLSSLHLLTITSDPVF